MDEDIVTKDDVVGTGTFHLSKAVDTMQENYTAVIPCFYKNKDIGTFIMDI